MKILTLIITLILFSCNNSDKKESKYEPKILIASIKKLEVSCNWADSIKISNVYIKTYLNKMDSITLPMINNYRKHDNYPFFKLNLKEAKKYIKNYHESSAYGVYVISKQFENEKYVALTLLYWGDCIWDIFIVTIEKESGELIDRKCILYDFENCNAYSINSEMLTRFSDNKFEVFQSIEYWSSDDKTIEDPALMEKHIKETIKTKNELQIDGRIKCIEKDSTIINVP